MRIINILPLFISLTTVLLSGCPKQNHGDHSANTDSSSTRENLDARADHWLVQQNRLENLRREGVVFQSIGNEPFWNVRLYEDETFHFIRLGADTIRGLFSPGIKPADLNSLTFPLAFEEGNMTLVAHNDSCTDTMSGEKFSHKVSLTYRDSEGAVNQYEGCGLFLNDPALNDIYVLQSWEGSENPDTNFPKGKPRLAFNLATNTLVGFDGDCEITGKFEPMGDRIFFKEFDYVDAACRPETRSRFFDHLNGQEHWLNLEEGRLDLTSSDQVLQFRKGD